MSAYAPDPESGTLMVRASNPDDLKRHDPQITKLRYNVQLKDFGRSQHLLID